MLLLERGIGFFAPSLDVLGLMVVADPGDDLGHADVQPGRISKDLQHAGSGTLKLWSLTILGFLAV